MMSQYNKVVDPNSNSDARKAIDQTLSTIGKNQAAGFAIDTALQSNPALTEPQNAFGLADLFQFSKAGTVFRRFGKEFASMVFRQKLQSILSGAPRDPNAAQEFMRQNVANIPDDPVFKYVFGVTDAEVKAFNKAINGMNITPQSTAAEVEAELAKVSREVSSDGNLSKTFNAETEAGTALRFLAMGVAFLSLGNSFDKVYQRRRWRCAERSEARARRGASNPKNTGFCAQPRHGRRLLQVGPVWRGVEMDRQRRSRQRRRHPQRGFGGLRFGYRGARLRRR